MAMTLGELQVILELQNQAFNASLRQSEAQLKKFENIARTAAGGAGVLGSVLAGIAGGVAAQTMVELSQAAGMVSDALIGAAESGFAYNNSMQQVNTRLVALLKDGALAAKVLADIRTEADKTPFGFQEIARSAASLIPLARQANEPLMDLVRTAEILAASNPMQGMEGAAYALREAMGGDFLSIIDRFDLPRQTIKKLREEGLSNIEVVRGALKELGFDMDLVGGMGQTLEGRWNTLMDALSGFQGQAMESAFNIVSNAVDRFGERVAKNAPQIQQWLVEAGVRFVDEIDWQQVANGIENIVGAVEWLAKDLVVSLRIMQDLIEMVERGVEAGRNLISRDAMAEAGIEWLKAHGHGWEAVNVAMNRAIGNYDAVEARLAEFPELQALITTEYQRMRQQLGATDGAFEAHRGTIHQVTQQYMQAYDAATRLTDAEYALAMGRGATRRTGPELAPRSRLKDDLGAPQLAAIEERAAATRDFSEQMARLNDDLLQNERAHASRMNDIHEQMRDVQADLAADIADLQMDYNERVASAAEDHQDRLAAIQKRGAERRANIEEDIARRIADFMQEEADRAEDYTDRLADLADEYEDKKRDLQRSIDDIFSDIPASRMAQNPGVDPIRLLSRQAQRRVMEIRRQIADEDEEYREQRERLERDEAKALERRQRDHQQQLDDLNQRLREEEEATNAAIREENEAYRKQQAELKTGFDKALAEAKERAAERVRDLRKRLQEEQLAHAETQAAVRREMVNTRNEHIARLAEIQAAWGGATSSADAYFRHVATWMNWFAGQQNLGVIPTNAKDGKSTPPPIRVPAPESASPTGGGGGPGGQQYSMNITAPLASVQTVVINDGGDREEFMAQMQSAVTSGLSAAINNNIQQGRRYPVGSNARAS
jgi:hypothetical protein